MQEASDAFATAVTSHRTLMPVRMRTDWADDGYDGDYTVDDLTGQVGTEIDIEHDLDDGYPNTVSFVSGTAVPELSATLGGRTVNGAPVTPAAYWSPLRADSPIYGYDRDIAPLTTDVGLVTADGPEYVRVFSGQMASTPVKGGKAVLSAVSAARIALMRPVQPPAFSAQNAGDVRASWPVSWALYRCGIYAGAAPRPGSTVAYYPMHGGLWRFHDGLLPGGNIVSALGAEHWTFAARDAVSQRLGFDVGWVEGPYVGAPDLQLTAALSRRAYQVDIPLGNSWDDATTDVLSTASPRARLEAWVRGDAADVNNAPGGSGSVSRLFGFTFTSDAFGNPSLALGVDTSRRAYVTVYDGAGTTRTLTSTGTLPTDGGWYFIGAAYDADTDRLWVNMNGTTESTTLTMSTANYPAADEWYASDGSPYLISYLPCADITVSTGPQANVDNYPLWRNDDSFAPTATVGLSRNELTAVAEMAPREAWQIIAEYAQAELAMLRCDELDKIQYLNAGYWVRPEQQIVQGTLSTARNCAPFDVDIDPTRIRTSVKVSYTQADTPVWSYANGLNRRIFEVAAAAGGDTDLALPGGVTSVRFTFTNPVLYIYPLISVVTGLYAAGEAVYPYASYVTLNDMFDGSGTNYTTGIDVTVTAWDPGGVTIRFTNTVGRTVYLVNDANAPAMCLTGIPLSRVQSYVQVGDTGARGERFLEVTAPGIQQELSARRLAQNLLANLRHPRATIGDDESGIAVLGDPRRQPGDLVAVEDDETGVSGNLWRLQSVRHGIKGPDYRQTLVVRQVYPVAIVGQAIVGQSLVGPNP